MDQLARIFGPSNKRAELGDSITTRGFNGNWLVRVAREAFEGGCREIAVRRVGGSYANVSLVGYNYVPDDQVTLSDSGAVNLTYGVFPTPNDTIAASTFTVSAVNGNDIRISGNPASLDLSGYVDWQLYFKGLYLDSRVTSVTALTLTLTDNLSSYITAGDELQIFPKGNYRVFDASGSEFNPANFIVTAGTATIASTIAAVTTPVTLDPRFSRHTPATAGESVTVQYLMKPDKVMTLQSKTPSDVYNSRGSWGTSTQDGCWVTITQSLTTLGTLDLYVPKYRSSPLTTGNVQYYALRARLQDMGTLDEVVNKINRDNRNTSVTAALAVDATWNSIPVTINGTTSGYRGMTHSTSGRVALLEQVLYTSSSARFTGGDSSLGMSGTAFYNLLTGGSNPDDGGILEELEEFPADVRVIAGVNADDVVADTAGKWVSVLAEHCWNASRVGRPCTGVIGTRSQSANATSASDVANRVNSLIVTGSGLGDLLATGMSALDDTAGTSVDIGAWLTVLAGPDGVVRDADLGPVPSNLAGIYAGLLSSLPVNRSSTQIAVPGVRGLLYEYNRRQRHSLTRGVGFGDMALGGAYTNFRIDPESGQLIVHNGVTAALRTSQYAKIGVVRIVQMAEKLVARAARRYLGQPNILPVHQSMENDCKKQLEALAEMRALSGTDGIGYQLRVHASGSDRGIGKVNIEMNLRTATEIQWIYVPVTVEF